MNQTQANSNTITITYLNRDGGGFAERHNLPVGTTVKQFLEKRNIEANQFTIRIVRTSQGGFTPAADDQLQEGDRLLYPPLERPQGIVHLDRESLETARDTLDAVWRW